MIDVFKYIMTGTKDTLLVRSCAINKTLRNFAQDRLEVLAQYPAIDMRKIIEYNKFIIDVQYSANGYCAKFAYDQLMKHNPKYMLNCSIYKHELLAGLLANHLSAKYIVNYKDCSYKQPFKNCNEIYLILYCYYTDWQREFI